MRYFVLISLVLASIAPACSLDHLDPLEDPIAYEMALKASSAIKAAEGLQPLGFGAGYDQQHLDLDLTLVYDPFSLDGTATWTLESDQNGLDEIEMELASNLTVAEVRRGSTNLSYTHASDTLTITLDHAFNDGQQFTIAIDYNGAPTSGMYAQGANGGIIHTFTEPYNSSEWFPCYDMPDDKFTCDQHYTVQDDWLVAANGVLAPIVDNGDGTRTHTWEADFEMPTYLIAMGASDYYYFHDAFNIGSGNQDIDNYVYHDHASEAQIDLEPTADMIEHLSTLFTDYRYSRYGHMITGIGGAMEHTTMTSYGSGLITGDNSYDSVVVHELGHQWWGDWVTCETWADIWLNEGFASYSEGIWFEHLGGQQDLQDYMSYFKSWYFSEDNGNRYSVYDPDQLFGTTVYKKGAWVLHMLRHLMGDSDFFAGLQEYADAFNYKGTATTAEFIALMDDHHTGNGSLDVFTDQWLIKAGYPEFDWYWWTTGSGSSTVLHIQVNQTQSTVDNTPEVFVVPIDFEVTYADSSSEVITVNVNQRNQQLTVNMTQGVNGLTFDPNGWLLCTENESTAVEYADATTQLRDEGILINWETSGDCVGVDIYRRGGVAEEMLVSGLNPNGGYLDATLPGEGSYRYTLIAHASDGTRFTFDTEEVDWIRPGDPIALSTPWPCPATESLTVALSLPSDSTVSLVAYDLSGRRVATLVAENLPAGRHEIAWETASLPAGVYLLRLEAAGELRTTRAVISR